MGEKPSPSKETKWKSGNPNRTARMEEKKGDEEIEIWGA
jgi:hypothetical protein